MRQTIRAASQEGFKRIAVVCGAWHAPALTIDAGNTPSAKDDAELLKGLPKIKTQATWTPWTYGRLSYRSGYGAGVESPGWYHHLWTARDSVPIRWMARVARLLREEDLDVSSAHVIIDQLLNKFPLLDDTPAILTNWVNLVTTHDVKGKKVHDARLVAVMQAHGVTHLLTFNTNDFTNYSGVTLVHPSEV